MQIRPGRFRRKAIKAVLLGAGLLAVFLGGTSVAADQTTPPDPPGAGPFGEVRVDGSVDLSRVPDHILTEDRLGNIVGYVAAADLYRPLISDPGGDLSSPPDMPVIPVYSLDDPTAVIGHQYPGKGYVPLGTDPADVPDIPVTSGPFRP